jgi:hypothetical protein
VVRATLGQLCDVNQTYGGALLEVASSPHSSFESLEPSRWSRGDPRLFLASLSASLASLSAQTISASSARAISSSV